LGSGIAVPVDGAGKLSFQHDDDGIPHMGTVFNHKRIAAYDITYKIHSFAPALIFYKLHVI
jgi:hypothetical protein